MPHTSDNDASRASSPAGERGAPSIVFSASWVAITTPIGEGAFSRVYEGVYTNPETLDRSIVAIKVLKKNMVKRRSDCLRFIKEAKVMTKITHTNIAACYGIGKYDDDDEQNPGSLFIVQELIQGGNLLHQVYKQMLNMQRRVYTSQDAPTWMIDVAAGMQYLHSVVDGKPMIIHRDLKLENIMLSRAHAGVSVAKLVDFGLHKVIDDRIKRVVKRVASASVLGLKGLRPMAPDEGMEEEEDELEAALRQQAEQKGGGDAGSNSGSGGGSVTAGSGQDPGSPVRQGSGGASRLAESPNSGNGGVFDGIRRRMSRLVLASPAMAAMPEEDEEDIALAHAEAATLAAQRAAAAAARDSGCSANGSSAVAVDSGAPGAGDSSPSGEKEDPRHARVRAPPKKQNSMQKLVAKMKEIKLRVTGKMGESTLGSQLDSERSESSASALPSRELEADAPLREKMARNEQLLNRIIAEQSTAEASKQTALDDLGIIDGGVAGGAPARRAPPRRAITWVNEIRYNLTEAVGSWAYMAPEVVLGQPYNEKVDVFSFGVILFEVLLRKLMLVDEIKNDPRKDAQAYAERVAKGYRPEIPRTWPPNLVELISACWAQDPMVRPNFTAVLDVLKEINEAGTIGKLDLTFWSKGSNYI